MKTRRRQGCRRFQLQIMSYSNCYYIERVPQLEAVLARKPRSLQLDMVGVGEISADAALRIRSALRARSFRTQVITNACSSLQNGSVLVWLLGDQRMIREDATLYFREGNNEADEDEVWKETECKSWNLSSDDDSEEGDYVRVLQRINEFLPVKELAGRLIDVPVLRQFGLIENEKVDHFLAAAFAKKCESGEVLPDGPGEKRLQMDAKPPQSRQARN